MTELTNTFEELQLKGLCSSVPIHNSWLTIGSFDGVHRGHQKIIQRLVHTSHAYKGCSIVLTFFPHPARVLRDQHGPFYLTTPEERTALLQSLGVDQVVTLTFDRALASLTAEDFMRKLMEKVGIRQLWVGYDFALGRGREGTPEILQEVGNKLGYEVVVFPPENDTGEVISSSRIRSLLLNGAVEQASGLLGRRFSVQGKVVPGDQRGRQIGFPTANLAIWQERLLPARGVYACVAHVKGAAWNAVVNAGIRPTFENQVETRVEAHLLGFSGELYGEEMKLEFLTYLRPEQRFSSVGELTAQIEKDILKANEVFRHGN